VRAISGARLTNTWTFVARRESLLPHRVSIGKNSLSETPWITSRRSEHMPSWSLAIPGGGHTKAECSDGAEHMPSWRLAIPGERPHKGRVQRRRRAHAKLELGDPRGRSHES